MKILLMWLVCVCLRAEILDIHTRFQKGQRLTLEFTKRLEDSRYKPSNWSATIPITATVVEAGESGFVLDWFLGEARFVWSDKANPAPQATGLVLKDSLMELQLDPAGKLLALRNQADLVSKGAKLLDSASQTLAAQIRDAAERKAFLSIIGKSLTAQSIFRFALSEASHYFALSGVSPDSRQPFKSKILANHPIGGGKISCEMELSVRSIDNEKKEAIVDLKQQYDPNGFAGMTVQILRQSGVGFRLGDSMPEVNMSDQAEYVVDLNYGWLRSLKHMRTTVLGTALRRVETVEYRLIKVELPAVP